MSSRFIHWVVVSAALGLLGVAPASAHAGLAVPPVTASTPSNAASVQIVGTALEDLLTVQRVDGERRVLITANRPIAVSGGCRSTGPRTAECVPPPIGIDPIWPPPGIVYFGVPMFVNVFLREGADTVSFVRSGVRFESTELLVSGDAGDDRISAAALRAGATAPGNRSGVSLLGGAGNDLLVGGPGFDDLSGGDGDDVVRGGDGGDGLQGGGGDDSLLAGEGADRLFGGDDDDALAGGAGDDHLNGGFGGDALSGGTTPGGDRDTVQYQEFTFIPDRTTSDPFDGKAEVVPRAGVRVKVGDGLCVDGGPEDVSSGTRPALPDGGVDTCSLRTFTLGGKRDEVLSDVEIVIGSGSDDVLIGSQANDTLFGDTGNDQLEGGGGADSLLGDAGEDLLLLRDGAVDLGALCGVGKRDRVLADVDDPVDSTCELVDRGDLAAAAATGGASVPPPDEQPPPEARGVGTRQAEGEPPAGKTTTEVEILAPDRGPEHPGERRRVYVEEPTPAGSPSTGEHTGGPGPGGGDGGSTPPEARIVSRLAPLDARGRARVLVTCVYRARSCRGTITLRSARRTLGKAQVSIPWGRTAAIEVSLRRAARKLLVGRRTRARALLAVQDSAGPRGAAAARLKQPITLAGP